MANIGRLVNGACHFDRMSLVVQWRGYITRWSCVMRVEGTWARAAALTQADSVHLERGVVRVSSKDSARQHISDAIYTLRNTGVPQFMSLMQVDQR